MKGKRTSFENNPCAVARSLGIIGDWWSLLIIRDALNGKRRFSAFQKSLGLAKNILSARLTKLVDQDIMKQVPAADGSAYREYVLTEKGERLRIVIAALWQWGEEYCQPKGTQAAISNDHEKKPPTSSGPRGASRRKSRPRGENSATEGVEVGA